MLTQSIRTATQAEMDRCISVMVVAFASDPGVRWMYPAPHQYLEFFPQFVKALAGRAFEHGSAYYVEGLRATALWLPPGVGPDEEALAALIERSVAPADRDDVYALFEQISRCHPQGPHWHLPLIGTDPLHKGMGQGAALLAHGLTICDQQHMPVYLEATSRTSVPLYQRHGFEVLGTIQVRSSPPIFPMLRKAR